MHSFILFYILKVSIVVSPIDYVKSPGFESSSGNNFVAGQKIPKPNGRNRKLPPLAFNPSSTMLGNTKNGFAYTLMITKIQIIIMYYIQILNNCFYFFIPEPEAPRQRKSRSRSRSRNRTDQPAGMLLLIY